MSKEFAARRLDIKAFAEAGAQVQGEQRLREYGRLLAETQGRGAESAVAWTVSGEIRNPLHVQPEVWLHLQAKATLPLTCQRCLAPVDVLVSVDRSFRFVSDEQVAAAQDEDSEEDVLALSRAFDLLELVEDEMLMEMPLAPRHETCPVPVKLAVEDADFDSAPAQRENPFAVLGKLKSGKS
jgi:uncharacterized protein